MTGNAERRRPLAVATVLVAAIAAALIAPVVIGGRQGQPIPGVQVRAEFGQGFAITQPVQISTAPAITIEEGTVALAGPGASESRMAALLRSLVMGEGADLILADARIVIDRRLASSGSDTDAPVEAAPAQELASVVAALSGFRFRSLSLVDTTIVLRTTHGTMEKFSDVDIEFTPQRHGLVNAKGQAEYRGDQLDLDIAFTTPKPEASAEPVQVKAAIKGKYAQLTFDGHLAADDRGITAPNAELVVPDLRAAAHWFGITWPSGPGLASFSAKGLLSLNERAIAYEHAEFSLDGNAATGALIARLGPERASIEGTLAFANFDIAPYAAVPERPTALALAHDWLSWIRAPAFASVEFLREADADIRISAANVNKGSERLGRLAASLSIKEGKAYGELAELVFEQGGSGEGQFTIDAMGSEPKYTLHASLSDVDIATVLAPKFGTTALQGVADVRMDVTAAGETEADMLESLSGSMSIEMGEGSRIGFDMAALPGLADLAAPAPGWGPAAAASTGISSLVARFKAESGVLIADTLEAVADDRRISAAGTIDIETKGLDVLVSVAPVSAESAASGLATGAYRVRGPWTAPTINRIDAGKAARSAIKAADPG